MNIETIPGVAPPDRTRVELTEAEMIEAIGWYMRQNGKGKLPDGSRVLRPPYRDSVTSEGKAYVLTIVHASKGGPDDGPSG